MVESVHPYSRGRNQLNQTVTIPGAKSIALHFDPRCRTLSSGNDSLQLFLNSSLANPVLGADRNPVAFSGRAFPRQRLVVEGNTVTFLFSAGSRNLDDPSVPTASRWGFKCTVSECLEPVEVPGSVTHWLLDLCNATAVLCARQAAAFLVGEPT